MEAYRGFKGIKYIETHVDLFFIHQFNERQLIDWIECVQIKTREENNENTIVFAPGFARTIKTFENLLREFYDSGRNVLSLNHPRCWWKVNSNPLNTKINEEALRKATSLYKLIISEINISKARSVNKKIDLIWHSAGWIDTALAALMVEKKIPWNIGNILLVNSAGLSWEDDVASLISRFKDEALKNLNTESLENSKKIELSAKENKKNAAIEFLRHCIEDKFTAVREINSIASIRLENVLTELKSLNKNINIVSVNWVDDKVFPIHKIQKIAWEENLDEIIKGFYSIEWWHNEIYQNPKKYIEIFNLILKTLNLKNSK